MKILIIVLASIVTLILLLVLLLLFKKTYIEINILNKDFLVKIGGKKLRINFYKSDKKQESEKTNDDTSENNIKDLVKAFKVFKDFYKNEKYSLKLILLTLRDRIKVEKADVSVKFGFGDAATTGIANGAIWSVLTLAIKTADRFINIRPVVNTALQPVFTEKCFDYKVKVVVSIRIYKMIKPLLDAYKIYKRNKVLLNTVREGE